jgi:hypothetical protein
MRSKVAAADEAVPLSGRIQALVVLLEGHETADELGRPPRELACPVAGLLAQGATDPALRWLCGRRLAEHLRETTPPRAVRRTFTKTRNLRFGANSCFALTAAGCAYARKILTSHLHAPSGPHLKSVPTWDGHRRELWFGDILVKRFRQPAKNQETILAAFQEEGWPPRIDDPLSGDNLSDAKDRLHESVRRLNVQQHPLIRFESDGTGEGILWKRMPAPKERPRSAP